MRVGVAWVALLAGCVEGPVSLDVRMPPVFCDPHRTCAGGLALGADVPLIGTRSTQSGPSLREIADLRADPPELGEISGTRYESTLHTLAVGTIQVRAEVDGDRDTLVLAIVPATVGPIIVHGAPIGIPAGTKAFAVYLGSERPVVETALVDGAGDPVAGHGLERWSPEGKLSAVPESFPGLPIFADRALARQVSYGADPVAVGNGADTITFVGRPLRSAASVTLYDVTNSTATTALSISARFPRAFRVLPATADALPLLGDAGAVEVSFAPPRATAARDPIEDRVFHVTPTSAGATTMTVIYDGVTTTYPVDITP